MSTGTPIDRLSAPIAPAETSTPAPDARTPEQLRLLAAQFESMLLSQMLNQMRSSLFDDEESDAGFGKGPLADAVYSELSLAFSRAGGFGLTDSLMAPLLRQTAEDGLADGATGMTMPASAIAMPALSGPAIGPAMAIAPAVGAVADPALFQGRVTSAFGWRQHPISGGRRFHQGVDIAMPVGRDVPVARAGQVAFAGEQGGYGLTVVVNHGDGISTRYAHLSELHVSAGDTVTDGQTIARSGATGRVTGAHLHFEVLRDGQPVDPAEGLGRIYARR